ncbi:MAG: DUF2029 domain-containing protein [Candidatus Omnitrophica bacterium]|nr:DUF2029 domain-containing protein [Candidatus Omnitrophota bacterium]
MMKNLKFEYKTIVCLFIIVIIACNFYFTVYSQFIGNKFEPNYFTFPAPVLGTDFDNSYKTALNLLAGHNIYEDNSRYGEKYALISRNTHGFVFPYGPLLAYLYIPFTFLAENMAYQIWVILIILFMLVSMALLSCFFKDKFLYWTITAVVIFFSYPLRFIIERGYNDILVMLLVCVAIYFWLIKRNDFLVGLFISVAILIKLYPLVFFIYFVLKREYRITGWIIFLCFILGIVSYHSIPLKEHILSLQRFTQTCHIANPDWLNHSLRSFTGLVFGWLARRIQCLSFLSHIWQQTALILSVLLYLPVIVLIWLNNSRSARHILKEVSLMFILASLSNFTSYDYRLVYANIFIFAILYDFQNLEVPISFSFSKSLFLFIFFIASVLIFLPPIGKLIPFFIANKALPLLLFYFLLLKGLMEDRVNWGRNMPELFFKGKNGK